MKKFIVGMLVGYLLTSIFSISAPPTWFWGAVGFLAVGATSAGVFWYRFNDDLHEGEF